MYMCINAHAGHSGACALVDTTRTTTAFTIPGNYGPILSAVTDAHLCELRASGVAATVWSGDNQSARV